MKTPKFKIGNTVRYKNEFSFNPASKVTSFGRIEGIHVHEGKGMFADSNDFGKIIYTVSGSNLMMNEDDLTFWTTE